MVSICMATYNGEKYIKEQLNSILNQTLQPMEVVICDDNSSDNTSLIINEFILENNLQNKWKLIVNNKNKGYPLNFYYAMEQCNGEIIFFADQDDLWDINKIESMIKILNENKHINLLSCRHGLIDEKGNKINTLMTENSSETKEILEVTFNEVMSKFIWPGMTMAIRKNYFDQLDNSFTQYKIPHDLALAVCAANDNSFYYYNYVGAYHRRHNNNHAEEEHRLLELISLSRKLYEIEKYTNFLNMILEAKINLTNASKELLAYNLNLCVKRKYILERRKFSEIFGFYFKNIKMLRLKSFICDMLILIFYKK